MVDSGEDTVATHQEDSDREEDSDSKEEPKILFFRKRLSPPADIPGAESNIIRCLEARDERVVIPAPRIRMNAAFLLETETDPTGVAVLRAILANAHGDGWIFVRAHDPLEEENCTSFLLTLKERQKCHRNSQLAAWKESGSPWASLSLWFSSDVGLAIPIVYLSNDCLVLEGDELDLTWSEQ